MIDSFVIGTMQSEIADDLAVAQQSCTSGLYSAALEKLLTRALAGLESAADALRVAELDISDDPAEFKTIEHWSRHTHPTMMAEDLTRSTLRKVCQ